MKHTNNLILVLVAVILSACKVGGSGSATFSTTPGGSSTAVTVTLKQGSGFECFAYLGKVRCAGSSLNEDLAISSMSFSEYATDSNSAITGLAVWDDTVCFESATTDNVFVTHVRSTICLGEATLATYDTSRCAYGVTPGSGDITTQEDPMLQCDLYLSDVITQPWITDGTSATQTTTEDCTDDGTTLTCETFTVNL